jgi:hypothetical protein
VAGLVAHLEYPPSMELAISRADYRLPRLSRGLQRGRIRKWNRKAAVAAQEGRGEERMLNAGAHRLGAGERAAEETRMEEAWPELEEERR